MVDKDYNVDINSEDKFEINIEDTTYTLEINPTDTFEIQLNEQGPQGDRGLKGDKGNDGLAATVEVGTTTTGLPGTEAVVTNVGTENNAILNFEIPAGEKGDKGDKGDKGETGEPGTTDYNELINKPTKLTDFEDDLGDHPVHTHEQYAEITDLEDEITARESADSTLQYNINTASNNLTNALNNKVNYSDISNMATTNTAQDITGSKSFVGEDTLNIRQQRSSDTIGINIQDDNSVIKGTIEYNRNLNTGYPLLSLNNYAENSNNIIHTGFSRYSAVSDGAYNLLTPLIANSKTPFDLTSTYKNFYMPLGFTDGNTTVLTANSGMVDISTFLSDFVTTGGLAITLTGYVTNASLTNTLANYSTTNEIAEGYYNKSEIDSKLRKLPTGGGGDSVNYVAGNNIEINTLLNFSKFNTQYRTGAIRKIIEGNGIICGIGDDTVAISNDGGSTWVFNNNTQYLADIIFNGDIFVGIRTDGKVTTSQDCITWTTPVQLEIPVSYEYIASNLIAYGNDILVAVITVIDSNNLPINYSFTSTDGINWSVGEKITLLENDFYPNKLEYIVDKFYISNTSYFYTGSSTDGITFVEDFRGNTSYTGSYGFASNGTNKLIAVGTKTGHDGVIHIKDLSNNTWGDFVTVITNNYLTGATYANGYFYVITITGTIYKSKDLTNWEEVITIENINNAFGFYYNNGSFIVGCYSTASGESGRSTICYSDLLEEISADDITSADVVSALGYTPADESDLSTVATTGDYDDLINKPTIPQEVFIAEYGTTSYADVLAAYNAGKEIVCLWKMWNRQSSTMSINDNVFNFHFPLQDSNFRLTLDSTNTWNTNRITLQSINNMVKSIDSSSTNSTYPTSKAVYDALPKATSDIENDSGFITDVITALGYTPYNSSNPNGYTSNVGTVTSVNNTQPDSSGNVTLSIPEQVQANWNETDSTNKAYIQNKPTIPDTSTLEKISNKVTSISSSSTDEQYPSAKCVYDNLVSKVNTSSLTQVQCIVETYHSGSSWYRVWSDGWCEQGGSFTCSSAGQALNFIKTYASTNYIMTAAGGTNKYGTIAFYNRTTSGCACWVSDDSSFNAGIIDWYACGYLY